ncbi:MAG: CcdB family protein [Acetobacteraceae bacterium]
MQFSLHRTPKGRVGYVVDVQADLLSELRTRVVIPLLLEKDAPKVPFKAFNPTCSIAGLNHVLMTQNLASVPVAELGPPVGSLAGQRDPIIRAMDALLSGL